MDHFICYYIYSHLCFEGNEQRAMEEKEILLVFSFFYRGKLDICSSDALVWKKKKREN